MEDRYFVADGGKFAAIFDGHGGADVSTFLRDFLYENVCHQLQLKLWQDESASSTSSSRRSNSSKIFIPSVSTQVVALRAAFEQMEKEVLEDDRMQYQGSTAVAVVVNESEDGHRTLLSANVGDSRAILSRRGRAVDLTRDHKPSDEWEKARILAMGESIEWDNFSRVHRVRNLSLSRAIGDRYAKPAVSSEVEIKHFLVLDTDEFVLLASDGLWDVMTSQEVVSFVHQRLDSELERDQLLDHRFDSGEESVNHFIRENMAKFVAREAIRRGSGDNISVVMVFLNDITMRSP
jgi:protein phosphatase